MKLTEVCRNYFHGFHDVYNYKRNTASLNVLAALKIFSYFTVIIPLVFAGIYGATSLCGRINKKTTQSTPRINAVAQQVLQPQSSNSNAGINIEPSISAAGQQEFQPQSSNSDLDMNTRVNAQSQAQIEPPSIEAVRSDDEMIVLSNGYNIRRSGLVPIMTALTEIERGQTKHTALYDLVEKCKNNSYQIPPSAIPTIEDSVAVLKKNRLLNEDGSVPVHVQNVVRSVVVGHGSIISPFEHNS